MPQQVYILTIDSYSMLAVSLIPLAFDYASHYLL
jgi:hypothetical protein